MRQKRRGFENGKLVEYWIDVPVEAPQEGTSTVNHTPLV